MNKILYIIGNGFDLSHSPESSFENFRVYLDNSEFKDVFYRIYPRLLDINLWFDFEKELANYSVSEYFVQFIKEKKNINTSKAFLSDDEEDIIIDFLENNSFLKDYKIPQQLNENFKSWINGIDVTKWHKKIIFQESSLFLTFNYTRTLEEVYNIEKEYICHIHGESTDDNLIFGYDTEDYNYVDFCYEHFTRLQNIISPYFKRDIVESFRKKHKTNIVNNICFFDTIKVVSNIIIYGHSLSEVDMYYFKFIKKMISHEVIWHIGCFNKSDYNKADNLKNKLGISDSCFKTFDSSRCFDLTKI